MTIGRSSLTGLLSREDDKYQSTIHLCTNASTKIDTENVGATGNYLAHWSQNDLC
jgi:hypothetical protein